MELKQEIHARYLTDRQTFNRTEMELKLKGPCYKNVIELPFNRTEMELKLALGAGGGRRRQPFNRTEMELKQGVHLNMGDAFALLIVPKWN